MYTIISCAMGAIRAVWMLQYDKSFRYFSSPILFLPRTQQQSETAGWRLRYILQLGWRYLMPFILNEFFCAVEDKHELVVVNVAHISRSNKSVVGKDIVIGLGLRTW
ncbi:hypothetical protein PsorP6_016571 [Peronosclerospora sorghi]|uniref:Uncharacterized protein n=1 Tax=Peronosclerospora sorghi TaxID=230839 RepID=A0ACC0VMP8_9STRA|nr:hypothetical protein PsorP6_016571 [Peronosclerospora sorghi]